jgi:hypothetical protein
MSLQLYEVCLLMYNGCSTVRCMFNCMSTYLYNVFLPVRCLLNCIMSDYLYYICLLSSMMSVQLYDVWLLLWCLLNDVMTARLCEVWSTVRCLPTCMMFAQLDVIHLHTYAMFVLLYDVCLPAWWLLNCVMSYVFCFAKWYEAKFRKFSVSWNEKKRRLLFLFREIIQKTKSLMFPVSGYKQSFGIYRPFCIISLFRSINSLRKTET